VSYNNTRTFVKKYPKLYNIYKRNIFRILTSSMRALPDFIIIGAGQSGTTSLYDYLSQHPNILPASRKEINFFDYYFDKGPLWYRSFFPFSWEVNRLKRKFNENFITGEATPHYLFNPFAPSRIFKTIPKVKLILILRNPVDRAYSHYKKDIRLGRQTLSFDELIKHQENITKVTNDKNTLRSDFYNDYNSLYFARGLYVNQLKDWLRIFSKNQFLVLRTEDLNNDISNTCNNVFEFLDLPRFTVKNPKRKNVGKYEKMDKKTREILVSYFKPYNEELYKIIGKKMNWDV